MEPWAALLKQAKRSWEYVWNFERKIIQAQNLGFGRGTTTFAEIKRAGKTKTVKSEN